MEVVRSRMTNRAFAPCEIPKKHFELVLEAARHGPSGANCQPWHYIIVTNPTIKQKIGQLFVELAWWGDQGVRRYSASDGKTAR